MSIKRRRIFRADTVLLIWPANTPQGVEKTSEPCIRPEEFNELRSKLITELEERDQVIGALKEEILLLRNRNSFLEKELQDSEHKLRSKLTAHQVESDILLRNKDKLLGNLRQECDIHQANNEL